MNRGTLAKATNGEQGDIPPHLVKEILGKKENIIHHDQKKKRRKDLFYIKI